MTIKLADNFQPHRCMAAMLSAIEAKELFKEENDLRIEFSNLQNEGYSGTETQAEQIFFIAKAEVFNYIQNTDNMPCVSDIAKNLRLDPRIVFSILLRLGYEIEAEEG